MRFRIFIYVLCALVIALWGLDQHQEHDRLLKVQEHFFSYDDRPFQRCFYGFVNGEFAYPIHSTGYTLTDTIIMNPQHIPEAGELPNSLKYDEKTKTITAPSFESSGNFQTETIPSLHIDDLTTFVISFRGKSRGATLKQLDYMSGVVDTIDVLSGNNPSFYEEFFGKSYRKK